MASTVTGAEQSKHAVVIGEFGGFYTFHDKEWNEQAARLLLLKFFEALGHAHPLTVAGRRSLSALIFA